MDSTHPYRIKVTVGTNNHVFADPYNGHLYKESGDRLKEVPDANGFKRVLIDGLSHNVSFICAKAFGLPHEEGEICIGHKDGDRANNRRSNLFWYGDLEAQCGQGGRGHYKAVCKVDPTTSEIITTYPSVTKAASELGTSVSNLCAVFKSKQKMYRGFKWFYLEDFKTKTEVRPKKIIQQIDPASGVVIGEWETQSKAALDCDISQGTLSRVLSGKFKNYKGYKWRYSTERTIPLTSAQSELNPTEKQKKPPHPYRRKVCQLDRFTSRLIKTYNSISEAAKAVGCERTTVWDVLKGRYINAKGFKWCYAEDYKEPAEDMPLAIDAPALAAPHRADTADRGEYRLMEVDNYKKRKVRMIDKDSRRTLAVFEAITYAARTFNIYTKQIVSAIKGKRSLCGYLWDWE